MDSSTTPATLTSTRQATRVTAVAESSAPPERPTLKRGDDTLTPAESALLLSALGTLLAVLAFITLS